MKTQTKSAIPPPETALPRIFTGLFGAFLGLALLKFCNPPVPEYEANAPPTNIYEVLFFTGWPNRWGLCLLALVAVLGLWVARWNSNGPRWLLPLPLVWIIWQFVASTRSVSVQLSTPTVAHLVACVICFYLGYFSLTRARCLSWFWVAIVVAFLLLLVVGWQQHFGGLKDTRDYFHRVVYPQYQKRRIEVPQEYLKKLNSDRIFSTLFYPNALAGALLLLLPVVLGVAGRSQRFTLPARRFLVAGISLGALGCLYWSGSKGGWLLMLLLALIALLRLNFAKRLKIAVVFSVLLLGLTGFCWKYSGFFQKGAPSVGARFDYWEAAVRTVIANPLFGTGPGTFYIPYRQIKRPESEPAKLVHNDYLEQASDSGLPGLLAYAVFIVGILAWTAPRTRQRPAPSPSASKLAAIPFPSTDWEAFLVWLGLLGWALQGLMEFGLYIPALAWPAFSLMGWLLGSKLSAGCDEIPSRPERQGSS